MYSLALHVRQERCRNCKTAGPVKGIIDGRCSAYSLRVRSTEPSSSTAYTEQSMYGDAPVCYHSWVECYTRPGKNTAHKIFDWKSLFGTHARVEVLYLSAPSGREDTQQSQDSGWQFSEMKLLEASASVAKSLCPWKYATMRWTQTNSLENLV